MRGDGDFASLVKRSGLPEPLYNARLYVGEREWHLSPLDWEKTMARHARMSAQGIIVLHFSPRQIKSDPRRVIAELRAALDAGRRRPKLPISTGLPE